MTFASFMPEPTHTITDPSSSTPHASLPTTLTSLPHEVLGPLLLRALPLAPACSPDLIARPCRAALAHLSAQQVAQWLLQVKGGGKIDLAFASLAGSTRSDREALAEHILNLCPADCQTDPYFLECCLWNAAETGAPWLFQLLLQRIQGMGATLCANSMLQAALQGPNPRVRLALLQSLPPNLIPDGSTSPQLSCEAHRAAEAGDASVCCWLLQQFPEAVRADEAVGCLSAAAAKRQIQTLPSITAKIPENTSLSWVQISRLCGSVYDVLIKAGLEACEWNLLVPLIGKLSQHDASRLARMLLPLSVVYMDVASFKAVAQLMSPDEQSDVLKVFWGSNEQAPWYGEARGMMEALSL